MNRNRLDILENRKKELGDKAVERLKRIEAFIKMVNFIKLNEDTKYFFELGYELYGKDIIDRLRKSTSLTPSEKDFLLGKFDLLNYLIIPFINKI